MRLALDIISNMAAAGIIFLVGWSWRHFYLLFRTRYARYFWGSRNTRFTVFLGTVGNFPEYEPSGLVALEDVNALAELTPFVSSIGLDIPIVVYARESDSDLTGDLILLGGPDGNKATRIVMEGLSTALVQVETSFQDLVSRETFAPLRGHDGQVDRDVGIVIKAPNPFDPSSRVIILSGGYGYGTRAAVRLATSRHFLNRPESRDRKCEYLFTVEIREGSPQPAQVVLVR